MSAARRAARRELQAAALLGTKRVHRSRFESAPDVEPVALPGGLRLSVEVKTRATLPALVTRALKQAAGYGARGDIPAAVLSATGGEPVIVLPLRAFRRAVGLEVATVPLFDAMPPCGHDVDPGHAFGADAYLRASRREDASTRHRGAASGIDDALPLATPPQIPVACQGHGPEHHEENAQGELRRSIAISKVLKASEDEDRAQGAPGEPESTHAHNLHRTAIHRSPTSAPCDVCGRVIRFFHLDMSPRAAPLGPVFCSAHRREAP